MFILLRQAPAAAPMPSRFAARSRIRAAQRRFLRRLPARRLGLVRLYRAIPAIALRLDGDTRAALEHDPGVVGAQDTLYGGAALADSVRQTRGDIVQALGFRGEGRLVAALDTGIDPTHPDVAGRIEAEECFCSVRERPNESPLCCPDGSDRMSGAGSAITQAVHGAHVAGIIASNGSVAAPGMAPAARILPIRVLNNQTRGALTDWIAALDWIVANRPDVEVINMSLVSDVLFTGTCDNQNTLTMAFADLFRQLRARGTVVVAASGNNGQVGRLPAPACVTGAVSIGAVTKSDDVASFSNASPQLDLLAPGVVIRSDKPSNGEPEYGTMELSGTSMAAPHVAGAIAALSPLVARPFLAALPDVLAATGREVIDTRACGAAGCPKFPRIDLAGAVAWLESVESFSPGGGGHDIDCQVEWQLHGVMGSRRRGRQRVRCVDGDSRCDADGIDGQCTFLLSACFNVPDARLPACDPTRSIEAYRLVRPSPSAPRDAADVANVGSILSRLPPLPIDRAARCTAPFSFIVPRAPSFGSRSLRLVVETTRGRDADRLRFVCLPP